MLVQEKRNFRSKTDGAPHGALCPGLLAPIAVPVSTMEPVRRAPPRHTSAISCPPKTPHRYVMNSHAGSFITHLVSCYGLCRREKLVYALKRTIHRELQLDLREESVSPKSADAALLRCAETPLREMARHGQNAQRLCFAEPPKRAPPIQADFVLEMERSPYFGMPIAIDSGRHVLDGAVVVTQVVRCWAWASRTRNTLPGG